MCEGVGIEPICRTLVRWLRVPEQIGEPHAWEAKVVREILYEHLDLEQSWTSFNIEHELTTKGIQKFVADYKATLRKPS